MEERFLVGVYDDLRQDGRSHSAYMDKATYIGTYYTEPEFSLYSIAKNNPALKRNGSTSILLEVYEVDKETLANIDHYNGCSEIDPYMNIYNRIELETPFGICFIYEYSRLLVNKPLIETGDWFRFKREIKEHLVEIKNNKIY